MIRQALTVGVDPGKKCGVAILLHGSPVFVRTIRGDLTAHVAGVLALVESLQAGHGPAALVVEAQFVTMARGKDGKSKSNPKALATLYKRRHVWEVLCDVYRIMYEVVYPATWQTVLAEVPRLDDDGEKQDTKVRSMAYCADHYPGKAKDAEQSDALAMASWRWRRSA
jgi:hypothetical protein